MRRLAIVDAGPLYAAADADDVDHDACVAALARPDIVPVVAALALAEATYLIGARLGAGAEAAFLRGLASWPIEAPTPEDLDRMAELVDTYANFPLGGADASVVALAERLGAPAVITLDRRHFAAVRPTHVDAFDQLP